MNNPDPRAQMMAQLLAGRGSPQQAAPAGYSIPQPLGWNAQASNGGMSMPTQDPRQASPGQASPGQMPVNLAANGPSWFTNNGFMQRDPNTGELIGPSGGGAPNGGLGGLY